MSDNAKALLLTGITALGMHYLISTYFVTRPEPVSTSATERQPILEVPLQPAGGKRRLDVAFCIDTTGSMQGEIDTVKATVKSLVAKLTSGQPKPDVRLGLVAFRDINDEYLTKAVPFTENVQEFTGNIQSLNADGGGDGPEEVAAGMHAALNELKWDTDRKTAKVIFLIGDAPPNNARFNWLKETQEASRRGIRINTIGCDELESGGGKPAFEKIARQTNGKFETLAYHQEVVDESGKRATFITSAGVTYKVDSRARADWKDGARTLVSKGFAEKWEAPTLQGATNGTIGPQGKDGTFIMGVNTAGTVVRADNNLDQVMLQGAKDALESWK